jgi:predicted kinase
MSDDAAPSAAPSAADPAAVPGGPTASEVTRTSSPSAPAEAAVILLVGPPAVGKLSIARELERRTGALVVDNHLINNPVFIPMGLNAGEGVDIAATDGLRRRIWAVVLEAAAAAPPTLSHVITNWLTDDPEDAAHVERLRALARTRGVRFVPVWLTASEEALLARVEEPGRSEHGKLTDPALLEQILAVPMLPAPADALRLDVTALTPPQAVSEILEALAAEG